MPPPVPALRRALKVIQPPVVRRAILYLGSRTLQPLPFQSPVGRTSWDSSSRDDTEIRSDAAATGRDGPFSMDAAIP
ncbi:unnamed protein product [Arctogadus glacialis]